MNTATDATTLDCAVRAWVRAAQTFPNFQIKARFAHGAQRLILTPDAIVTTTLAHTFNIQKSILKAAQAIESCEAALAV
jgi:hypothetical protein